MTDPISADADGFGRRSFSIDPETGEPVELLEFVPELLEHPGFVGALAERVARLSTVRHASYVHLRRLDRPSSDRLLLISDRTPGWRLSEMLSASQEGSVPIDITIVIALLRQLLPAVALFSRHNRENAIGTLSPHRLIVTPHNRLVIAEHAFGPALEKLNFGREKLWREFRIAMPASPGVPRADQRGDANAVGVVALSLLLGRVLRAEEYPSALESLLQTVTERRASDATPLSAAFSNWLSRALQFDSRTAFQSAAEAQLAFESVLASDRSYVTSSKPLEEWVRVIGKTLDDKNAPAPAPEPEPHTEPEPEAPAQTQAETVRPAPAFLREDYSLLPHPTAEPPQAETAATLSDTSWAPQGNRNQYADLMAAPPPPPAPSEDLDVATTDDERVAEPVVPALGTLDAPDAQSTPEVAQTRKARKARKAAAKANKAREAAENPTAPDAPQELESPDASGPVETPSALDALDAPDAPEANDAPEAPEAPQAPEAPYAPQAPYAPDAPLALAASDERSKMLVRALAGLVVLLIGVVSWQFTRPAPGLGVGEGELVITSSPEGARVTIEGTQRGVTPLTVRLNAGAYVVEVQAGTSEPRVIPVQVRSGMSTAQYVELQGVAVTGGLEIRSEPSGARVVVDGHARGTTPMTIRDLSVGEHTVVLEAGSRKVQQSVRVEAGATARVTVPMRR